ncbi:hypothetical protein ASF30_12610 [Leifsonia sp. Leaf264]|nr:hypothetical protein ASF30_12610 [Leifsonia sp. Leaf264]
MWELGLAATVADGPTWLAEDLVPAFAEAGATQYVLSNLKAGNAEQILRGLNSYERVVVVTVGRDTPEDVTLLLCEGGVLLSSHRELIEVARTAGLTTVAVDASDVDADVHVSL